LRLSIGVDRSHEHVRAALAQSYGHRANPAYWTGGSPETDNALPFHFSSGANILVSPTESQPAK